jgi:hypothetical protein
MLQINMKWGCFISSAAWSWIELKYTFATIVCLVLMLHHVFESSKRTFITLLSSVVKQSKGALICPRTSWKGAKTSWMEAKYTFATMVCLVLVLHHGFESSKRTFITLLSSVVKQSKGALICPQTSQKGAKTLYIYAI